MIDERELIKTLLQWKENSNKFAGLKEDALIDKVIAEVTNMSIRTQIEYLYGISDDAITLRMCAKLWRQLERMEGEND